MDSFTTFFRLTHTTIVRVNTDLTLDDALEPSLAGIAIVIQEQLDAKSSRVVIVS